MFDRTSSTVLLCASMLVSCGPVCTDAGADRALYRRTTLGQVPASQRSTTAGRRGVPGSMPAAGQGGKLEDPGGRALASFYEQLSLVRQEGKGQVRITHWGDSHIAADALTGQLRRRLQRAAGNAGPGFVLLGKPWPSYWHSQVKNGASRGWRAERLRGRYARKRLQPRDDLLGLAGVSVYTPRRSCSAWVEARRGRLISSATLYYLQQPGGGSVELWGDGKLARRRSTRGTTSGAGFLEVAFKKPVKRVELRTGGARRVRLYGVDLRTSRPGVIYDALGINGARATQLLGWNESLMKAQLEQLGPDLVVLAYGANEVDNTALTRRGFAAGFDKVLKRLRAVAPAAACLITGPTDRARYDKAQGHISPPNLDFIVAEQRRLALAHGCAFWDQRAAMGGRFSIFQWISAIPPLARTDHVHLTPPGYRRLAELLYAELARGLDRWERKNSP